MSLGHPERGRGRGRTFALAAVVTVVIAALGAPLGLLWAKLSPTVPVVMTERGAIFADPQPEQFAAGDAWFVLLGVSFGVLAAVLVWKLLPSTRGPLGLIAISVGTLAAGIIAWRLGRWLGLNAYQQLLDTAAVGQRFGKPVDLLIGRDSIVPAFAAAAAYTLLAGWSRHASLRDDRDDEDTKRHGWDPADFSWDASAPQAPTGAPAPPAPGAAAPPPG